MPTFDEGTSENSREQKISYVCSVENFEDQTDGTNEKTSKAPKSVIEYYMISNSKIEEEENDRTLSPKEGSRT